MNRLEATAGLSLVALAIVGLGHQYVTLKKLAQTPPPSKERFSEIASQARPVSTVDSAVHAFLSNLDNASDSDRLIHLGELITALNGPELHDDEVEADLSETLSKSIVSILDNNPDVSKEGQELRRRAVGLIASRVPTPTSKDYILKVMTEGPQELREEAISHVGFPRGVRGASVYAKVRELGDKGLVPDEILPSALRRTGGLKARETLVTLMNSTDSAKLINGCVIALQDYRDPELMGSILARLEQVGRLDSGGKLPWLSASLLDAHLKTADRPQMLRGLTAMSARPGLVKIEHVQKGLESPDAETRRMSAVAVKKAVLAKVIDASVGETMLANRLTVESEQVLKAELTGGLERVRSMIPTVKTTQQ